MTKSTEPFRPYCGTYGADWMAGWCDVCERDRAFRENRGDSCEIVASTMIYGVNDPEYPKEWIKDKGDVFDETARCTAFEPELPNP